MGIVAGVAVGALIGVLFAPEKGTRLRRGIVRKGEDLADALNDKIDERFDELMDSLSGRTRKAKAAADREPVRSSD